MKLEFSRQIFEKKKKKELKYPTVSKSVQFYLSATLRTRVVCEKVKLPVTKPALSYSAFLFPTMSTLH
jgi:hypothetical protein